MADSSTVDWGDNKNMAQKGDSLSWVAHRIPCFSSFPLKALASKKNRKTGWCESSVLGEEENCTC